MDGVSQATTAKIALLCIKLKFHPSYNIVTSLKKGSKKLLEVFKNSWFQHMSLKR